MSERPLRHVIIGVGASVLAMHRPALALPAVELAGVMDADHELGQARAAELGCSYFSDHQALLTQCRPDIAVILTPHPWHAPLAIDCLAAGCHVLVEKPIAVQVKEADEMVAAARAAGRLLAVSHQQRYRTEIVQAHKLIQSGALGTIQQVTMVVSWLRTAAYFRLGGWRATWAGEGGGVLINQSIHDLDILCHLLGSPSHVMAWTQTNQHAIETEDTVQAIFRWPGGALGSLFASTAVGSRPYLLEIAGSRGWLKIESGSLSWQRYPQDVRDFIRESSEPFGILEAEPQAIMLASGEASHMDVYANFHAAIRQGEPLLVEGASAVAGLELANAITLAGALRAEVALPLEREAYAGLLAALIARSGS